jgi:hypothetical protein
MSHFAKIENGIVTRVIVAEQDFINSGHVGDSFLWVQTSYNGSFRKNYAGVGFTYDKTRDAFIPPKPFNSWLLNEDSCQWDSPTPHPEVTGEELYEWIEDTLSWVEVEQV